MSGISSLRILAIICLISAAGVVRAEAPPALPFREHELADALAARLPGIAPRDLTLAIVDGRVLVTLGAHVRLVDLGDAKDVEAARVLALVIADLAREPLPQPPTETEPVPPALAALPARPRPADAQAPSKPDRARLGLDVTGQRGLAREESWSFDVGIAASTAVWRNLLVAARVGYTGSPAVESSATGTRVRFSALSLRPALGVRLQLFELSAGPSLLPFWLAGGEGRREVLAGAHVQLALWAPLLRSVRLLARLCFDLFANRTRMYAGSDQVLTTPRVMAGLALGVGWGFT